jgi:transposase
VISLEVTDDKTHDSQKLGELIDKGGKRVRIKKVLGDGGYDTKENFDLLQREGIEPGIKVRENSKDGSSGARGKVVQEYLASKAKWKEKIGYGKRWIVESFFSAFKRMFGEVVRNKRWERILKEIELKVYIYNLMLNVEPG